jgi:xanthine dehydrogenase YagR molybdenum-binding subunit
MMLREDQSPRRFEAALKVQGAARFTAEIPVAGMLHAALVTASVPSGRVTRIDATEALALPGIVRVLSHEEMPRIDRPGVLIPLQAPLVHHAGQPVALVAATTPAAARRGAAAVEVAYQSLPAALSLAAGEAFAPRTAGRTATDSQRGDPKEALLDSDVVIERRYTTAANNHHPLEPQCVTAHWQGEQLTVLTATQAVFAHRQAIAECFGLKPEDVRIVSHYLGGGFGAKGGAWFPCLVMAIAAARALGRPLRLELTRAQMFTLTGRRQETVQDLKLGAMKDGRLTAIVHASVAQTSAFADYADPLATVTRVLHACPNVATTHRLVRVNAPQPNPARAPGEGPGSFALESALDELAYELDLDPLELRLCNLARRDQHTDLPWSSNGLSECYRVGAASFGWAKRPRQPGSLREGRQLIGLGMAAACYPAYRMASEAAVAIGGDGRVKVRCGTQDMGSGTYTVLAQLAAEALGVPYAQVDAELGDSLLPEGPYSGGSMATASFTPAVEAAARDLRQRLLALASQDAASPLAGIAPDRMTISDSLIRAGNRSESLAELVARSAPAGLEARASAAPETKPNFSAYGFGAVFAEVRVDADLGEVRVRRLTPAYAAGRILNPLLAKSQYVGGLIWGIGMALHEATVMDPRLGRVVGASLADYLIPVHADMPAFDIHMVAEDEPLLGSGGVKGIGMLGTVGTAAAIANAVFHATGKRVRDLPIRIEHLL